MLTLCAKVGAYLESALPSDRHITRENTMGHTLTLSPFTNVAIFIMAIGQLALVGAVVFLAFRVKTIVSDTVKQTLDATLPRVQPVIDNVSRLTEQVSDIVETVAPQVEKIAQESEDAVHSVSSQVKATSHLVTENVSKPIVNIAAILAGVQRGMSVWRTARIHQDNVKTEHEPEASGSSART
jgi:uncharacterized protein YoxC